MKINSDLSEKGPKGKSFAPDKLKNHTGKGKGKEKKKEKARRKKGAEGKRKKQWLVTLIMAMVSYTYS